MSQRLCIWCGEPVRPEDDQPGKGGGVALDCQPVHRECLLRQITGGLNHLQRLCSCYGGRAAPDPDGMTRREAARIAADFFKRQNP
jgi:hypothetical protein